MAEDIWDRYGSDFGTDYSGLFNVLSHTNLNVRMAAGEALAAALDENPETVQVSLVIDSIALGEKMSSLFFINFLPFQETLSTLFSLYIRDLGSGMDVADSCWLGRQGIALALLSASDVLRTKDLPVVMTFLISRALVSLSCHYSLVLV